MFDNIEAASRRICGQVEEALADFRARWPKRRRAYSEIIDHYVHPERYDDSDRPFIRFSNDPDPEFSLFVRTCCELDRNAWTPADDFYAAFRQFQAPRTGQPDSREKFGRRIARAKVGIRKRRRRHQGRLVYGYQGVRLIIPAGVKSTPTCENARNVEQVCASDQPG